MYKYICILLKYINGGRGGGLRGMVQARVQTMGSVYIPPKWIIQLWMTAGGRTAVRVAVEHLKRRKRDNNLNSSRFQTTSKVLLQEQ